MSRQWRMMKKLKWAGYAHGTFVKSGEHYAGPTETPPADPTWPNGPTRPADVPRTSDGPLFLSELDNDRPFSGLGHPLEPTPGQMTLFCPACPQIDVNVGPDWEKDTNAWVYSRFIVLDGNFKADHVRQKHNDDIWLSNGGGMFAKEADYMEFLKHARERKAVRLYVPQIDPSS